MSESQRQIAREAAEKCVAGATQCYTCHTETPNTVNDFLPHILSAIERSTEQLRKEVDALQTQIARGVTLELAQPQHSEQQEWTPLSLAQHFHNIYERCAPKFGYETRAETKHFNPDTPNGKLMIAVCSEILRYFNAALTAERQRREQATERYCLSVEEHAETKMQLLSALVAIEAVHDAEVLKPLVDLLREVQPSLKYEDRVMIDDALAKVKIIQ